MLLSGRMTDMQYIVPVFTFFDFTNLYLTRVTYIINVKTKPIFSIAVLIIFSDIATIRLHA